MGHCLLVLSRIDENRVLLKVNQEIKPPSIATLAEMTGRKPGRAG